MGAPLRLPRPRAAGGPEPVQPPGYAPGTTLALIYFAGFTGIFFVLTLFFQTGLGYSALLAGLAVTPFAAGSAVTAAVGGRFVTRTGRVMVVSVSCSCWSAWSSPT